MLRVTKLTGSTSQIVDYYANKENYYFSQAGGADSLLAEASVPYTTDEPKDSLKVHGQLVEALGFKAGQAISSNDFSRLMDGVGLDGQALTRRHKISGLDLTFSAPKSVSVAGLVTDKDPAILAAHEQAVAATMRELEAYFAYAQPKAGENVHTGKMVYVTSTDGFSREHDPHIHTHVVVPNLTENKGRFMALRMHEIFREDFVKLGGVLYRQHLAENYRKQGREIAYTKSGEWRDVTISHEVEREFSTRHEQIVAEKVKGRGDMTAWENTRADKEPGIDKEFVKTDWRDRLAQYAVKSADQVKAETLEARKEWASKAEFSIEANQERLGMRGGDSEIMRWQLAVRRATERTATATPQTLATEYMAEHMRDGKGGAVTYKEALKRLEQQVKESNLVEIEGRYTSWELLAAERDYMDSAGKRTAQSAATKKEAATFLEGFQAVAKARDKRTLSDVQLNAVKEVITRDKLLTTIQGDAGAGKTTALRAVADYYQRRGVEVVGLAMQGVAAKNLETETGIKSMTVSSFLRRRTEGRGRVLVFDETSMLDSRNAAKLFRQAERNGDRVLLVGDRNQLQSIAAGKVFERLVADSEAAGDLISLNENFRQRDPELRKAVDLARAGKMKDSLAALDKNGGFIEISDKVGRLTAVAGLYDKDTLIIAGTGASRDALNGMIRGRLEAAGKLKQGKVYDLARPDKDGIEQARPLAIAPGEVITFTRNEYDKYDIRNGDRVNVVKCDDKTITVKTEDGRELVIDTAKYKGIDYGYALTTYKSQGQTYNSVVVESDTRTPSLLDMRNQYVNITRARDKIRIYTDDKEHLAELAEVKTYSRDTVSDKRGVEAQARLKQIDERLQHEAAVTGIKSPTADRTAAEPRLEIKNKYVMEKVEGLDDYTKKYTDKMKALTDALNNSKKFTPEAKAQISAALNTEQGAKAILKYHDRPEEYTLYAGACLAEGSEAVLKKYNLPESFKSMQDLGKTKDRESGLEM